jgi:hypothetical protein
VRVRHGEQGVTIGRRLSDRVGADDRTGSRAIFDHERLLERLRKMLCQDARVDIGRPASGERHDDLHRAVGIILGDGPCEGK